MKRFDLQYYLEGLKQQNNVVLAQAITLVESKKESDQELAYQLLDKVVKIESSTFRIGITGTPGVGKSSFIEGFGNFLIDNGKRVAVLAIDPSSQRTGGSILGDKTRMETLSKNPGAFIRPSASGNALGGVNNKTREALLLCEAAGYDVIIVETVGVGQSETLVSKMVDFFLLMIQPGSGDDLQGIKKGIMEMADGITINKADGDQAKLARQSKKDLLNALHLFALNETGWTTQVELCSAVDKTGFNEVWLMIQSFYQLMTENDRFDQNRQDQNVSWFKERVNLGLIQQLTVQKDINELMVSLTNQVKNNALSVSKATHVFLSSIPQLLK